jgi:hypothetical protein
VTDWDLAELDHLVAGVALAERMSVEDVDSAVIDLAAARRRRNAAPLIRRTRQPLRLRHPVEIREPRSWSLGFWLGLRLGGLLPNRRSQISTCGDADDLTWE